MSSVSKIILLIALSIPTYASQSISVNESSAILYWTAPGDNGNIGQAFLYDIRYSTRPVGNDTGIWWLSAAAISGQPRPSPAGHIDSCRITGLVGGQIYYFAMRTADEVFNWSEISNITRIGSPICADVNGDGSVNIKDIGILIHFVYIHNIELISGTGDLDGNSIVDASDITYLVNYLYKGGPEPKCA